MANYQAENIKSLDYFEHIRKYPGMYVGSRDEHGLLHCVKEILSNSIDEYLNGSGNTILVKLLPNNGIYIEDNGRGIPHGKHSSGCSTLQACFGIANTGGKFDNASGESGYNTSGGEHGTGGKAVNALSKKMIVSTSREGLKEIVEFSRGKFINYKKEKIDKNITGTSVEFYPDEQVLEVVEFDEKAIKKMIKEFSFLCKNLKFIFIGSDKKEEVYFSKNGLLDFIDYLSPELITSPMYIEQEDGKFKLEAVIGYNKSYSSTIKLYTNNIPQEKGTHLTGFKTAWTSNLNAFARENGLLKEKDENLSGSDYDEGLVLILNFKMIDPVFKGQNKEELSSSEGRTYVQRLTTNAFASLSEKDLKIIVNKALSARKAREAAKKARDAVREPRGKEKGLKAKLALSDKFIDCTSKNPRERKLFLLEGLSAGAAAVEARNPKTDCIYLLRGKIISPLKTEPSKILQNQEMSDLVRIIGAGFGKDFDISKAQFDKVVIFSDSDSDGDQICLLLMGFFYTYMRELVTEGRLYRGAAPLYTVKKGEEELYFYTDKEYNNWQKDADTSRCRILRGKGVGELQAEDLHRLCFASERFKRLTVENEDESAALLDILLGSQVAPRKQYIYDNAVELGFKVD